MKGKWFSKIAFFALAFFMPAFARAEKKVVIIAGLGGEEVFQKRFAAESEQLYRVLQSQFGYKPEDLILLASPSDSLAVPARANDATTIRSVFKKLASELGEDSELLVFLIGHGSFDGEWARFNIPGPDLRDVDFAAMLDRLQVSKLLFVNSSSASGPFVEKLSRNGRILITATRNGIERNATHFFSHLLATLEHASEADLNKDGLLSTTELFINTRDRLVKYYSEQGILRPEHPLLEDDGDGEGTETPDILKGDGAVASRFFLQQNRRGERIAAGSAGNKPVQVSAAQKKILARVEKLQSRKSTMPEDQYYREFERLMLELARLNSQQKK